MIWLLFIYQSIKQANSVPFPASNPCRTFSCLNALAALHFVPTPFEMTFSLAVQFDPDKTRMGQYVPQPAIIFQPEVLSLVFECLALGDSNRPI
jgi:hypothetical protein